MHYSLAELGPTATPLYLSVMVNFMCQPDWAMECPGIWPNITLGVSVRTFLDEINI